MLIKTTALQNSASNPINSAFVSASAGSGKTKVLTDRVLRLLLEGVLPSKILCLTFTKIAAAQMQKRIFAELENWVICDDEELKSRLKKLTGKESSNQEIKNAKKLFALLLDDNSGLQISTIHSFCQSIIKKFPVEAKTSPNFSVIDSGIENKLLLEARKKLLTRALQNKNLASKINLICASLNENSFLEISFELIQKRQNLAELKERYFGIDGIVEALYEKLEMTQDQNEETVFTDFIFDTNWQKKNLLMLCEASEIKSKKAIEQFINEPNLDNLEEYFSVFLTSENEPRKKLTTKEIQKKVADAEELMLEEQERVVKFLEKSNTAKIAVSTAALLIVVDQIIEIYSALKSQNGYLDYSDLIIKTSALLENSSSREWVKYKLDGSYQHILVDESQDTNHSQWNIIKAITEEFFGGESANNKDRTIFIVGDEKQSIYSFQGADPNIFANIFYYYQNKLDLINEQFLNVELNSSFRSLPSILKVVDQVFLKPELANSISALKTKIEHNSIKNHHVGIVELLPIVSVAKKDTKNDEYCWKLDFTEDEEYKSQEILAQIIAKKIKKIFTDKKFLATKNRYADFGDVMILLKERKSNLGNLLIKYLNHEQIPVSSLDRINFSKNIIVQDLLSLAKFVLLPEDDLNLACLLKSPFFNISEEELLAICLIKNDLKISLFKALEYYSLQQNILLYQELINLIYQNQQQQFSIQRFFSYFLISIKKQEAVLTTFGKVGEEIINQFLKTCIDYQSNNIVSSLQSFVQFLESSNLEIKIDNNNQNKNQVFITTIHSAKGLEAPIVFLADTLHSVQKQFGNDKRRIFWDQENTNSNTVPSGLPFWSGGKTFDNKNIKEIKKTIREITKKEYWRQLYVAMTRAEEELYVCGFTKDKSDMDCWYNAIKEAMENDESVKTRHDLSLPDLYAEYQNYLTGKNLVIGEDFIHNSEFLTETRHNLSLPTQLIDKNLFNQLPLKETSEEFLYPSKSNQDKPCKINLQEANLGKIIHKILELLPDLKIANKTEFLEQYLANQNLSETEIQNITNRINIVFEKFSNLLNHPNGKSEVPIIAKINNKIISGKIDRLIITESEVLIIDFKTGKNEGKNESYQEQLHLYEQSLLKLYPNKNIKSQIIWV